MDAPTVNNTTFVFHDLTNDPNTRITMTITNTDGTENGFDMYILKPLADQARSMTKAQLVAMITRQNADTESV